ncbi:MAG: hypothetical protein HONBIEJF_00879 [Fimbriimonadaceae bacterium]|nr:hypothetical protein [Fimbriimonadaceae bacterium]
MTKALALLGALIACVFAAAQPIGGLMVDVSTSRSADEAVAASDAAFARYGANAGKLTRQILERQLRATGRGLPFSTGFPTAVYLMQNGRWIGPANGDSREGGDITLAFDDTGDRVFPTSYRSFLQGVFDKAKPTMDALFGPPAQGGPVRVTNYDADIGDRDAVAGGYFLPNNGQNQMEIRFPIYNSPEAGAVNFIHTLLLAYLGPRPLPFESWNEGLVRAVTMKVARTAGSLPADLNLNQVEAVLESTYDVGTFYDWYNQKALSGPNLIAPNLRSIPLPDGGSLGGIYLLRFQMAGSAFQKALVQYPAFAAKFNELYRANFNAAQSLEGVRAIGQQSIVALSGVPDAKLEGQMFADWSRRQHVLDPTFSAGIKLLNQPFPILSELQGDDFGVFAVQATYFETQTNGNEVLLSGTCFPIFWGHDFIRIFTSIQDEQMDVAGAYGSVVPNFPSSVTDGAIYRVACDLPIQDHLARVYLPAGAIATANQTTPNDFYGTIAGIAPTDTRPLRVRVSFAGKVVDGISVVNFAFGTRILHPEYSLATPLLVEVIRGADEVVYTREVNKGPGSLALDLRTTGYSTLNVNIPKGISLIGMPHEPDVAGIPETLGIPAAQTLAARWNPARSRYDLFPSVTGFRLGHGHFVRMNEAKTIEIPGYGHGATPMAVALRPGWNLISPPASATILTSSVQVVVGRESPVTYAESRGVTIGNEFFTFQPGPNDPVSGAPEVGTMAAAGSFEPGKGYYVRCLSPEGATLLFSPPDLRSRGLPERPRPGPRWELKVTLYDGSHRASMTLAQARGGSKSFDKLEDAQMAPGMGGMQIVSGETLSRDVRAWRSAEIYRMNLSGLRRGTKYVLTLKSAIGQAGQMWLKHGTARPMKLNNSGYYVFVARGSNESIDLYTGGARP